MFNKIINKKNIFIFLIFSLLFFSLFYIFLIYMLFPQEIYIIQGKESRIDFNFPAVAATVISDELIYVNNEEINKNQKTVFNEPLYIKANNSGNTQLRLSLLGIPIKKINVNVLPDVKLIPCGNAVGVRINTNGVMVLGLGEVRGKDDKLYEPCEGSVKTGDIITEVNGSIIGNKEELIKSIEESTTEKLKIKLKRETEYIETFVNGVIEKDSGKLKLGIWVRDSTQGIGTLTFYDSSTGVFGALGHGITDVDTKQIINVRSGKIMSADIVDIKKGEKGIPGELIGEIDTKNVLGEIKENNEIGIYGTLSADGIKAIQGRQMEIALKDEIKTGKIEILSNINGNTVKSYEGEIESINRFNGDKAKGMIIKITDKELLDETNGIVQGMSGSPIIQDGKLVGAVTHVFVREPDKGYGIFIENMIS